MQKGVYLAKQKDGTLYYRSNITFAGKHISLGSYSREEEAADAYREAKLLLTDFSIDIHDVFFRPFLLSFEKVILLLNFRDNKLYIKNPIYLRKGYFSYFLSPTEELKFDIDDLFYYSSHKILRRQGHLFVNDYGMQYSILSRCGVKPYAVPGRDFEFVNGDSLDYRYANIRVKNHYHGVRQLVKNGAEIYKTVIHINGDYKVGCYETEEKAAIAYNKAADLAKAAGCAKSFPENYIESCSPKEYADIYTQIKISKKYLSYLKNFQEENKT